MSSDPLDSKKLLGMMISSKRSFKRKKHEMENQKTNLSVIVFFPILETF